MHIVNPGESVFRPLLDREKTLADVKRAFSSQLQALSDIVNYGTNLIPRCYGSSDKGLEGLIVVGTLLGQVVAMLDAMEVLASNGAVYAAALQARALFEAAAQIDWILLEHSEEKATYYYVHNLRRQLRWAMRLNLGSPESAAFVAGMPDLTAFRDPRVAAEAKRTIDEVNRVLSQTEFASVNKAFNQCTGKKRGVDPAWYVPLGKRSVSALVKSIGKSAEYTVFYASYSEVMHSSNYAQRIRIGKEKVTFQPIRELSAFHTLFRFCVATALHTYHAILTRYRPGELAAFGRKYSENWQSAFMGVPVVKYEIATTEAT
jgi:hypothetical protein